MPIKIIIIGGVAGGATAATRARRLDETAEIIIFERGEYISFANCGLPYYIGDTIRKRNELFMTTPAELKDRYRLDVRTFTEVTKIDRVKKQVEALDHVSGKTFLETYDKIILSPGAEPVKPPLPGIDLENIFRLRNIPDTDRIKTYIDVKKPKSAVIVGAGFIGLEMAENLVKRGVKTTIVEMIDQVMAPLDFEMAAIVRSYIEQKGVKCELGNGVKSFEKKGEQIVISTSGGKDLNCDLVLLSIGIKPENTLAKECGLTIGSRGGIVVDPSMRTSDPDIFAVGDAVEVKDLVTRLPVMTALAGPANKQGRIAADNAVGRKSVFKGTQGTAIVKIFDLVVGCTGTNEKTLRTNKIPYRASITHSASHASYYPGADTISTKILFSPTDGKLLGSQIVGSDGADKRIDVLATAIRAGMTVYDLEEIEHAYAPPFSSAKDPVNIAGFVASNILRGDVDIVTWNEAATLSSQIEYIFLDLRDKSELEEDGSIMGAVNIPLNSLRSRLHELEKSRTYLVFCAVGLRAYIGCRILTQNGYKAKNISGGYTTYMYIKDRIKL